MFCFLVRKKRCALKHTMPVLDWFSSPKNQNYASSANFFPSLTKEEEASKKVVITRRGIPPTAEVVDLTSEGQGTDEPKRSKRRGGPKGPGYYKMLSKGSV